MKRKQKIIWIILLSIFPFLYTLPLFVTGQLDEIENKLIDLRYRLIDTGVRFSDRVVLVDIDEGTLETYADEPLFGRWPWRRDVYRPLLEYIGQGGPRLILFDIMFTERSRGDSELAAASAELPVSNAMQFRHEPDQREMVRKDSCKKDSRGEPIPVPRGGPSLPPEVRRQAIELKNRRAAELLPYNFVTYAAGDIGCRTRSLHSVTYHADPDGISRRSRFLFLYEGKTYPSLALRAFMTLVPFAGIRAEKDEYVITVKNGSFSVPLEEGAVRIHYPPREELERAMAKNRYSMGGVVESIRALEAGEIRDLSQLRVSPEVFRDRVVIIGTSAAALHDVKLSPYDVLPGMMLHGVIVSDLLQHSFLTVWPAWSGLLAALLLLPLSTATVIYTIQMYRRILIPALIFIAYISLGLVLFRFSIAFSLAPVLVSYPVSFLAALGLLTLTEGADKRKFKNAMSKYLSPDVLNEVISRGELRAEVGNRRNITVLFSDIRSFTTISEKLDAARVVEILNEYLSRMVEAIFASGGTLDKYIGDAIMAFWGAPVERKDHAALAVQAAFAMKRELAGLHHVWEARGDVLLNIGVGIHTGEMIVGNIGSERRLDYTVIGDNVNLGSRIEGLTKTYGVQILISESTFQELNNSVTCRMLDLVAVKGKSVPIAVYEPLDGEEQIMESMSNVEYASAFNEAFDAYRRQEWDLAQKLYKELRLTKRGEDPAVSLMLKRIRAYRRKSPGEDWDGSFAMTSK